MDSDSSTELEVKFALSISADRNNFLRRSCDSCGRYFKTEIDSADLQWALSEQVRRLGAAFGRLHVGRFKSRRRLYSGIEV